ncbi:hypothetical protein [Roseicella aquatilis]|uniref:Uncharacterized protein n=1 Tax=Roseicella aquatilis TaxID=2527868 RepID=A0A4R4DSV0_9PROT|nr:hypothetical protein [Roseicella aquatilis]TCZ64900.1 hypothetical protein EXY23_05885 [Roseicella aquatilis]
MRRRGLIGLAAMAPWLAAAETVPPLSDAQVLLFETPHLAVLRPPLRLEYSFLREEDGRTPVRDTIRLEIRAAEEEGRRDVRPEFLTGPRALHYPEARGFRGNPLLLYALDRDARELSAATGGSMGWFRNRIRQSLVTATARRVAVPFEGRAVEASEIELLPFAGEPRARRYQERRFTFLLAEAVPGWLLAIRTELPAGEAGGAVREAIAFEASQPLPEHAR